MQLKRIFFTAIVLLFSCGFGTAQSLYWVKNLPGASYTDSEGYTYKTGGFEGTYDFDPGPGLYDLASLSDGDGAYVVKIDPSGNLVWAHAFSSENWTHGSSIVANESGQVFIWGSYKHEMDADPGPGSYGMPNVGWRDCFLIKLKSGGEFAWAKNFGGSWYEFATHITLDSEDNIILTGQFDYNIDCDPGPGTHSLAHLSDFEENDDFIIKLSPSGDFIWATNIGVNSPPGEYYYAPYFQALQTDSYNDIYIGGKFEGSVNFDPWFGDEYTDVIGDQNGFILKETSEGDFDWVKSIKGASEISKSEVTGVVPDNEGHLYICGSYSDSALFDGVSAMGSSGLNDCFILKLDATNGNTIWHKTLGGIGNDIATSICLDPEGNISVYGQFEETVDFDPGPGEYEMLSMGESDLFLLNLNPDGEFNWAQQIGNEHADEAYNFIATDADGNIHCTGDVYGYVDFEFGPDEVFMEGTEKFEFSGTRIPFLLKIAPCELSRGDTTFHHTCEESFVWDETDLTYDKTGIYEMIYESDSGCDSVVYLHLTTSSIDVSVTQTGTTLTADLGGAIYQWVDCDNDFEPIDGATDQIFNVLTDGSYAVIIDNGECTDTSECVDFLHFSITENGNSPIQVYPNPSNGHFEVNLGELAVNASVRLFTAQGQLVYENVNIGNQILSVDFEGASGFYWMEITNNGKSQMLKIIKTDG